MKLDIAKGAQCGSIHIAIEYKSEYKPSLIRALWKDVSAQADRILASMEWEEQNKTALGNPLHDYELPERE